MNIFMISYQVDTDDDKHSDESGKRRPIDYEAHPDEPIEGHYLMTLRLTREESNLHLIGFGLKMRAQLFFLMTTNIKV